MCISKKANFTINVEFQTNLIHMSSRPILLIDDDPDDLELIENAIREIDPHRQAITFSEPHAFLDYVRATDQVFLFILCDINMSKLNGLQLKKLIYDDERLRMKCVPFIFFSTSRASASVEEAYSYNVQGYFIKPSNTGDFKYLLEMMIAYWSASELPNHGKSSQE